MWILNWYSCVHVAFYTIARVHREMYIKTKKWAFLNESRITWLLAFHMPKNAPNRPSIIYWRDIYSASCMHWKRRIFQSKETIVNCCLIFLCLSLHPFVHLSTHRFSSHYFHWDGGLKWWRTRFLRFSKVSPEFVTIISVYY